MQEVLSTMNMKFGQILLCCMINISNMFLANAGDWKLVPGPYDFVKVTIQQDLAIFTS